MEIDLMNVNLADPSLIAPCGINCRLCMAYEREKKACPGCRGDDTNKAKTCVNCRIKNCEKLAQVESDFCYECDEFPCYLVTRLDKRYRLKYGTSPIDNLRIIQESGMDALVKSENNKWICPECGAILCMHRPHCLTCGYLWNQTTAR